MRWTEQAIHFVDFEGSVASGILEYGVVTLRGGEIVATDTRLCRATGRIRAEDTAVHGIAAEAVGELAPFGGEFERFAVLRETGPLAAHFAGVENSLLKAAWPYPRSSPDFVRPGGGRVVEWGPWIDTGRLYPQLYPSLGSAKLGDLVEAFGLRARLEAVAAKHCPSERCRYHAALYDALAGALLLSRLTEEPAVAERSLAWLISRSTLDPRKREELDQGTLF